MASTGGVGLVGAPKIKPFNTPPKPIGNPTTTVPGQIGGRSRGPSPSRPRTARAPRANPNNYGLNVNSKQAFDPFAQPGTVGQFNREVLNLAQPGYQPALDQNAADKAAENAANKQRNFQLKGIYSQYGNQAQQAFNETRDALTAMIGQNNQGNTEQQATLMAALKGAQGAPSGLGAMMGISGAPSAQDIAPYMSAAQGQAAGTSGELGALSGGLLSTTGAGVSNAALEGAQQSDIESQRHEAALQSGQQSRDAIVAQIPAIIEKAREQLITDILNSQGLQFQQNLAGKQFGLSQKVANANISNAQATLTMNQQNAAANRANALTQLNQNQQTIDNNAKAIAASINTAKAKLATALAKVQGQREANAVKYLAGYVLPTKLEYATKTTTTTLPNGTPITTRAGQIDMTRWHRDPNNALTTLRNTYGLSLPEALALMTGINTPIGGRQGGTTIGQWAATYLRSIQTGHLNLGLQHIINRLKHVFG